LKDKNDKVRNKAILALGKVGGDEAMEHLKRVLGDEDAGVRYTAAEALRRASGSKKEAAVLLGISRQSLYRYIAGRDTLIETATSS
jgi:HEAT repeat protein